MSFAFDGGEPVLGDVDLAVEQGEFVAVAGPNGGGKTTLIRLGVGLLAPSGGRVRLLGEDPRRLRRRYRVGYLPQRAQLGIEAPVRVDELVAAGRTAARGIFGRFRDEDRTAVAEAIARVGLEDHTRTPVRRLSGGQQQRAFIAKVLAARPEILLLDEPTSGVDADAQEALASLLDELRRALGVTIVFVSHEFGAVEPYVERLVLIRGGVVFDGSPGALPSHWHDPSHVHLRG